MATSHDIGGVVNNQIAAFGNMTNAGRSIPPFGVQPQGGVPGQMTQAAPSFGMMGMAATAFTPMGPAFAPPGTFPGMGLQRSAMGMTGAAAQAGGQMIPGMGTLGVAGFAAAGLPGMAAGMAAGAVGDFFTNTVTQTVQNMNATANMMQSQRFQFGSAGALQPFGGFTARQAGAMAGGIQQMGMQDVLTSVSEVRDITSQLANMGVFQIARDVPEIMGRLGEAMKAIRAIAVSAQTTLSGAIPILGELRQAGFTNMGGAAGMVQQMAAGQRAGVSMTQQMQAGGMAAQQAMQMGLPGQQAFSGAVQATINLARARQRGVISEEDFQRLTMGTGDPSVAGLMQQQQNLAAMQGPMAIIAGGAGVLTGGFGAAPFGNLINTAAGNLANPSAMIEVLNRQDMIAGAMAADQFAMVRVADSMAQSLALPTQDPDQARQIVLQKRFGMTPFQARMMVQQYSARHQLALGQTMDALMQAETDRVSAIQRQFTPQALMNRIGRGMFNVLGGATVAETIRNTMAGVGTDVERFFRKFAGTRAFVTGAGTEEVLAGLIAGTEDIAGLRDVRRTGVMDAAGGLANALGFTGLGRRAGGIMATDEGRRVLLGSAAAGDFSVETALKQVEEVRGMRASGVLAQEREDVTALISSIEQNRMFMTSNADVLKRFERVRADLGIGDDQRRTLLLAAAATNSDFGDRLLEGVSFGRLDLEQLSARYTDSLESAQRSLAHTGERIVVPGRGPRWVGGMPTGLTGDDAATAMKVAQDADTKDTFSEMAEAYAEGNTRRGNTLLTALSRQVKANPTKFGEDGEQQIRNVARMWAGPQGKERVNTFLGHMKTAASSKRERDLGTAAIAFGTQLKAGLQKLPDELREKVGGLVDLMKGVGSALQDLDDVGFRRASQRLTSRAITEFEIARQTGEGMQELTTFFRTTGMEAVLESISELSPEERGVQRAAGVIRAKELAFEKQKRKLTGDEKAGQKLGASGAGGSAHEMFQTRLSEYVGLNTKILAAALSGKKFKKIGAELAEESSAMLDQLRGGL